MGIVADLMVDLLSRGGDPPGDEVDVRLDC